MKSTFLAALRLDDPADRRAYLERVALDDPEVAHTVERLLQARDQQRPNLLDDAVAQFQLDQTGDALDFDLAADLDIESHPMVGGYKLLEKLAEGGMGIVCLAEQQEPVRRKVAMKLIKLGMDSREVVARFEAERQALAIMDHPNIAKIYDAGVSNQGRPYFVMELVRGVAINQYCDDAQLSIRERLELFIQVCRAVQHAHHKGIIHRDLKPSNILVTLHDGTPVPKVIDFGIAKALDQPLTTKTLFTRFAELVGTPMYMSPEQAEVNGLDIDTRSDVYSLGVVLYELLAGVTPFDRDTFKTRGLDEVRRIIREESPQLPSRRIGKLDIEQATTVSKSRGMETRKLLISLKGELDWIVMKALEKDRQRRYESPADLVRDLQRYLDNRPVIACPPSTAYRLKKWARRNRWALRIAAILIAATTVTCAVSVWQMYQVRQAWRASQQREQQTNDLLEAAELQGAVTAFRQGDLIMLREVTLSRTRYLANRARDGGPQSTPVSGSLFGLLSETGEVVPDGHFHHRRPLQDIACSANGDTVVAVDLAGDVLSWQGDISQKPSILGSHDETTHAVAISPDGHRLATGSTTGQVWLWDIRQRKMIRQLEPLPTGIETLTWSPDGRWLAAGARYSAVRVFNRDGDEHFTIENDQRHETLLFFPDSSELVVPTRRGLQFWNVSKGTRRRSMSTTPVENIRAMCWAGPRRQWLVVGDRYEESLSIIDIQSEESVGVAITGRLYPQHLAASPDGKSVAVIFRDGVLQVFQISGATNGRVTAELELQLSVSQDIFRPGKEDRATVRWRSDDRLITAVGDKSLRLWSLPSFRPVHLLRTERSLVWAYPYPPDNLMVIPSGRTGIGDRLVQVDFSGTTRSEPGEKIPFPINAVSRNASDRFVAVAGEREIVVLSLPTRQIVARFSSPIEHHKFIEIAPGGETITAIGESGGFVWRSTNGWKTIRQVAALTDKEWLRGQPLFLDGDRSIALLSKTSVGEWRWENGERRTYKLSSIPSRLLAVDGRSRWIAVGTDRGIDVLDRQSGESIFQAELASEGCSACFSANGRTLLTGHGDGRLRAWHLPTKRPLGTLFELPDDLEQRELLSVCWHGNRLVLSYRDAGVPRHLVLGSIP